MTDQEKTPTQTERTPRPFLVTLLLWAVLILTIFNLVRFGAVIAHWATVAELMPAPGPVYILLTGLVWGAAWMLALFSIFFCWGWARWYSFALALLYSAYYWVDRLLFQAAVPRSDTFFTLLENSLLLIFVAVSLFFPNHRAYFLPDLTQREHYD